MSSDELSETAGILFMTTALRKHEISSERNTRRCSINLPDEVSESIRTSLEKRFSLSPFCVFLLYGSGGGGHKASVDAVSYLCKVLEAYQLCA